MRISKSLLATAALSALAGQAFALDVNLITGTTGTANGALFFTTDSQSTGTGVIDPFLRIQDNGIADGYNASSRPVMPDVNTSPTFTHDLLLSAIPIVTIGGVQYREFLLDINQTNANPFLSLDQIQIRQGATNLTSNTNLLSTFTSFGSLVYNLDVGLDGNSRVLLDYSKNNGSGTGDMFMYVLNSSFSSGQYVYLYSSFGDSGGIYAENDGFEEWATRTPTVTPVPEPETYALMLAGLGFVGYVARRRRQV